MYSVRTTRRAREGGEEKRSWGGVGREGKKEKWRQAIQHPLGEGGRGGETSISDFTNAHLPREGKGGGELGTQTRAEREQ